jgi:hypothetical protein
MTALEKRIDELALSLDFYRACDDEVIVAKEHTDDLRELLRLHKQAKRELARIRKLARMSGVDKHWWKVGGVKI